MFTRLQMMQMIRSITMKEIQLAELAKRGHGHSEQANELRDDVAELDLDYRYGAAGHLWP
jgi:hypothetical protein